MEITNIFSRSVWKKKFFNREKRREIEFRQKLIDKVNAAEKFNAEVSKLPSKFLPVLNFYFGNNQVKKSTQNFNIPRLNFRHTLMIT